MFASSILSISISKMLKLFHLQVGRIWAGTMGPEASPGNVEKEKGSVVCDLITCESQLAYISCYVQCFISL